MTTIEKQILDKKLLVSNDTDKVKFYEFILNYIKLQNGLTTRQIKNIIRLSMISFPYEMTRGNLLDCDEALRKLYGEPDGND